MVTHVSDNSNLSQEIFAIDPWGTIICFLGHGRKHMLTIFPTIRRPGLKLGLYIVVRIAEHAAQLKKHVLKLILAILTTYMETRLKPGFH